MKICVGSSVILIGLLTIHQGHFAHAQYRHPFCKGKASGNYEDPDRCDGYIACNGPILYKMDCPASLHYNKKTDRCDWAYNLKPRCQKGSSVKHVTVCEQRRKTISCGRKEVIKIMQANYGRLSRNVCRSTKIKTTNCRSRTSEGKVSNVCNMKQRCSLYAKNSVFGDPCVGTFKYLSVAYKCVPKGSSVKHVTVCEHRRKTISCGRKEVIKIMQANYGRLSRNVCRSTRIRTTDCRSRISEGKVNNTCNMKQRCSLYAKNSVFGDPCVGTYKYLSVAYKCVPKASCASHVAGVRPGAFVPKCKGDGTYEAKQCHSSTGQCWCVQPNNGKEIKGTRKPPGGGQVNCDEHCPKEKGFCVLPNGRDQNYGVIKLDRLNGNTPQQQQRCLAKCRAHPGATGCEEIWNRWNRGCYVHTSLVARGNGARNHACWVFSKCTVKGSCASHAVGVRPGAFVPKCKGDGTYEAKQCHSSTGHCWCVQPNNGKEIKGTRKPPGGGQVNCGSPSWSTWSGWSTCSSTCVGGVRKRTRKCEGGSKTRKCVGNAEEIRTCEACEGQWSSWSSWSACTKTCGSGETKRQKICRDKRCNFRPREEKKVCNVKACKDTNPCSVNNGGCSDICNHKGSKVICSCDIDSILADDKKTCIPVFPVQPAVQTCGKNDIVPPVVPVTGGTEAEAHKWSWQVGIYSGNNYVCDGVLISADVVVTSAACVPKRNNKYVVKAGDHDRSKPERSEQQRDATKVVQYNTWRRTSLVNNVAVIVLKFPFLLSKNVGTVCLPDVNTPIARNAICYVTGWGKTNAYRPFNRLHQAQMSIVRNDKCTCPVVVRKRNPAVTTKMLCGELKGSGNGRISGFRGGFGGPLVCRSKKGGSWVLRGIHSWGSQRCKKPGKFSVFTRISAYVNWINQVQDTSPNQDEP